MKINYDVVKGGCVFCDGDFGNLYEENNMYSYVCLKCGSVTGGYVSKKALLDNIKGLKKERRNKMRRFNLIEVLIELENTPKGKSRSFRYDVPCGDYLIIRMNIYGNIFNSRYDRHNIECNYFDHAVTTWFSLDSSWYEQ